jgi:ferrous iron transport protein A
LKATRTLADLRSGERATIVAFESSAPEHVTTRLRHLGFRLGEAVVKTRVAPFGDPAVYEVLGYEMCLRTREAGCVMVEGDS